MSSKVLFAFSLFVIILSVSAFILIPLYIYHGVSISLEAEETLHANEAVLHILMLYVRDNPGRWPERWEDLERMAIPDDLQVGFRWPQDSEEFKKRVEIQFGLTLEQVSEMDVDHFTAVRPIGPNYGPCEHDIKELLEQIRQQTARRGNNQVPPKPGGKTTPSPNN